MKLKERSTDLVNTYVEVESFLFHDFFPEEKIELKTEMIVGNTFKSELCSYTQIKIRDVIEPGEGEIHVISSSNINYRRSNVKTAMPTFMSMFILECGEEKRYFILEREYSRDAFYDFTKYMPALTPIGAAFLSTEEKRALNKQVAQGVKEMNADKLKI